MDKCANRVWKIIVTAVLVLFAQAASAERRALLIGIDDYSANGLGAPLEKDLWPSGTKIPQHRWQQLSGAVADVTAMEAMLRQVYKTRHIEKLTDRQATRAGIRAALTRLVAISQPGDEVLFYYAGHGSQVISGSPEEPDGLDETLVPADSAVGAADLRDKELRRWLNQLLDREVHLTVILDSCHSATGVRGDPGWTAPRGVAAVELPRVEHLEAGPPLEDRGAVVLAAALDHQTARERCHEDGCFGAFTRALLDSIRLASHPESESAAALVKRTRARLRLYEHVQEPVLTARPDRRNQPLFGGRQDRRDGSIQIAIESLDGDLLQLQGGWVNGLTVGSELRWPGSQQSYARVSRLDGPDRAEAKLLPAVRSQSQKLRAEPGGLLELAVWAPPPGEPLRLWIPPGDYEAALALARELAAAAERAIFQWEADPLAAPTHILSFRTGTWHLDPPSGASLDLGPRPQNSAVIAHLDDSARLYVRLPPPRSLMKSLRKSWADMPSSIARVHQPQMADYLLTGTLEGESPRYAWLHRSVLGSAAISDLPARSRWTNLQPLAQTTSADRTLEPSTTGLLASARALGRIHGWMTLESSESKGLFPYRLTLEPVGDTRPGATEPDGANASHQPEGSVASLAAGTVYDLVLETDQGPVPATAPRYVYVFTIDPSGRSQLLYPPTGAGQRFPQAKPGKRFAPARVVLDGARFEIVAPFGRDTYFLFASSELIHDIGVFEWDPVRSGARPRPTNALEQLLENRTSGARASRRVAIPAQWTIERLVFDSRPAVVPTAIR